VQAILGFGDRVEEPLPLRWPLVIGWLEIIAKRRD
jgi:hypothetical protein